MKKHSLRHAAQQRTYYSYVPAGISEASPLLLVFHGGGGSAEQMAESSGFNKLADIHKFIVVYPQGYSKGFRKAGSWNAGGCCGPAHEKNVDDVGFVRSLLRQVQGQFSIDPNRVYASGHSNGAMMSYRLACELSDHFAAIAPVGGVDVSSCRSKNKMNLIHVHGKKDACALYDPYDSSDIGFCPMTEDEKGRPLRLSGGCVQEMLNRTIGTRREHVCWRAPSVEASIGSWKSRNKCEGAQELKLTTDYVQCEASRCADSSEVVSCVIPEGGHAWPGGSVRACKRDSRLCGATKSVLGDGEQGVDAAELIWRFLRTYRRL